MEGAFALGERFSFQVSRATGDAVVDRYESIFSPPPLSQSLSLATSQDVEALASSALLKEQHTCEVTSDESQGPEQTQDDFSDLVPNSSSSAPSGLAAGLPSTPPLSSSQDISAHSSQVAKQQILREDTLDAQELEQKHDASEDAVSAALDYELVSSVLLASDDMSSLLYERGLCGGVEGALPVGGGGRSEGEEVSGRGGSQELFWAEPSKAACRVEDLEEGEINNGEGIGDATFRGRGESSTTSMRFVFPA